MIYKRKLFMLLVMATVASLTTTCPMACTCRHRTVRCSAGGSRLSLARVPSLTQHLYLSSSSSISSLSSSSLPSLPHLTSLSLANTGITAILPGAFSMVGSFSFVCHRFTLF